MERSVRVLLEVLSRQLPGGTEQKPLVSAEFRTEHFSKTCLARCRYAMPLGFSSSVEEQSSSAGMRSPLCVRADNEGKGRHVELQAAATPGVGSEVEHSEMYVRMHNVLTEL